ARPEIVRKSMAASKMQIGFARSKTSEEPRQPESVLPPKCYPVWQQFPRRQSMRLLFSASMIAASLCLVLCAALTGEPALISVFPLGGQEGAEFQGTVRGRSLDAVSAVWFDCEQLSASVVSVENDKSGAPAASKKGKKSSASTGPLQLLTLAIKLAPGAEPG